MLATIKSIIDGMAMEIVAAFITLPRLKYINLGISKSNLREGSKRFQLKKLARQEEKNDFYFLDHQFTNQR